MTPQPRHIEAARTIVRPMLASYHVSPKLNQPSFDPYEAIATALAEAENRAAWDGYDTGCCETGEYIDGDLEKSESIFRQFIAKYGSRPITENQP